MYNEPSTRSCATKAVECGNAGCGTRKHELLSHATRCVGSSDCLLKISSFLILFFSIFNIQISI